MTADSTISANGTNLQHETPYLNTEVNIVYDRPDKG